MICDQLKEINDSIPANVQLVAVSKTKPASDIETAYNCGQRVFGENKVQEMVDKAITLPIDIEWHLIGHLQTNKVKHIAPFVSLIHSVDSLKLAQEINKQALKNDRKIDCLIQFHIAQEETKFGFSLNEAVEMLKSEEFGLLKNLQIVGVMGMASFSNNQDVVRDEFKTLKNIFKSLKNTHFSAQDSFKEVSMGMSGDYQIAIEEGSSIVRIGSSIFGSR